MPNDNAGGRGRPATVQQGRGAEMARDFPALRAGAVGQETHRDLWDRQRGRSRQAGDRTTEPRGRDGAGFPLGIIAGIVAINRDRGCSDKKSEAARMGCLAGVDARGARVRCGDVISGCRT